MAEQRFTLEGKEIGLGDQHPDVIRVQNYLTRFGYLTAPAVAGTIDPATANGLLLFQRVSGLEQTGRLDLATQETMLAYRCGVPDAGLVTALRSGVEVRFHLSGCRYNKRRFTYRFLNGTPDVGGDGEQAAVRRAFNTWASVLTGVSFTQVTHEPSDFAIAWHRGKHGDSDPFDGSGDFSNTLAHAFFPPPCGGSFAGELHFDDAEKWRLRAGVGVVDVQTVALHEIGHLLGLDHTTDRNAVMNANIDIIKSRRQLTRDDIRGVRRIFAVLARRGDSGSQAGTVNEIAATTLPGGPETVTAVRTRSGRLKVITWDGVGDQLVRTGDSGEQAGRASSIAVAPADTNEVVTAFRTESGALKLIGWDVTPGRPVHRHGDSADQGKAADLITIVRTASGQWATPYRNADGRLSVVLWSRRADGSFQRRVDSGEQGVAIRGLAATAFLDQLLITAVITSAGIVQLLLWQISDDGVQLLGDSGDQGGRGENVRLAVDEFGNVVTAIKDDGGRLKLITWQVSASGAIRRLADSDQQAGHTGGHDLTAMPAGRLATPVITEAGTLKVLIWETGADGTVTRYGDDGGRAGRATAPTVLAPSPDRLVTAVVSADSDLKLIGWTFTPYDD